MKKVLSIALAVAFIFAAMSISVFAANPTLCAECQKNPQHVVGHKFVNQETGEHYGDYRDGVEEDEFTSATGSHDITISFDRTVSGGGEGGGEGGGTSSTPETVIVHKYAVDVEYKALVINMAEILDNQKNTVAQVTVNGTQKDVTSYKYVWDVNAHKYVLVAVVPDGADTDTDPDEVVVSNNEDNYAGAYTIDAYKVINHSDLAIHYKDDASPSDNAIENYLSLDTNIETISGYNTNGEVSGFVTVEKATAGLGEGVGEATASPAEDNVYVKLIAKPAANNETTDIDDDTYTWLDVVNAWGSENEQDNFVIGTLTITIVPNDYSST